MLKNHKNQSARMVLACLLAGLLAACGGGSSTGSPTSSLSTTSKTGYFIDSPVEGLHYQSGSLSGLTDSQGAFQYLEGQPVTFSIGNLVLGSLTVTNSRVFPVDLVNGATDETHPKVSLMAQILQTLDSDGNAANGITLTETTRQALNQVISLTTSDPAQASAALTQLMATATQGRATALRSASTAQSHLQANLIQEYAGTWTGSFNGGDQGNCQVAISNTGAVTGTCTSDALSGNTFSLSGTVSSSGESSATSGGASTGATFTGTYLRGGQVTGQWRNSVYNIGGSWTLHKS